MEVSQLLGNGPQQTFAGPTPILQRYNMDVEHDLGVPLVVSKAEEEQEYHPGIWRRLCCLWTTRSPDYRPVESSSDEVDGEFESEAEEDEIVYLAEDSYGTLVTLEPIQEPVEEILPVLAELENISNVAVVDVAAITPRPFLDEQEPSRKPRVGERVSMVRYTIDGTAPYHFMLELYEHLPNRTDLTDGITAVWRLYDVCVEELCVSRNAILLKVAELIITYGTEVPLVNALKLWFRQLGLPQVTLLGPIIQQSIYAGLSYTIWTFTGIMAALGSAIMCSSMTVSMLAFIIWLHLMKKPLSVYCFLRGKGPALSFDAREAKTILRRAVRNVVGTGGTNGHPQASRHRDAFVKASRDLAKCFGTNKQPYFAHLSRRSASEGHRGVRRSSQRSIDRLLTADVHLAGSTQNDPLTKDDVLVFVDCDYYYDMEVILLLGLPVILYSWYPPSAGITTDEYSYYISPDNEVRGKHAGGKSFNHKIWHYGDDVLRVAQHGLAQSYKVYNDLFGELEDGHKVIFLVPNGHYSWSERVELTREKFVDGNVVTVYPFHDERETRMVSLGIPNLPDSDEYPLHLWQAILRAFQGRSDQRSGEAITTHDITTAVMEALTEPGDDENEKKAKFAKATEIARVAMTYVQAYFSTSKLFVRPPLNLPCYAKHINTRCMPNTDSITYENIGEGDIPLDEDEIKSSSTEAFPALGGASSPAVDPATNSVANVKDMVEERITKPQRDASEALADLDVAIFPVIEDFISQIIGENRLVPIGNEELEKRLPKPNQKAQLKEHEFSGKSKMDEVFIKPETYQEAKAVRPIMTNDGNMKWCSAPYIYSFLDYLKGESGREFPWFIPGKRPTQVADRIVFICTSGRQMNYKIVTTDFSKFDGTVNALSRYIVEALYVRAFYNPDQLVALSEESYGNWAAFRNGDKDYERWINSFNLGSGRQDTSIIGCLINAFCAFSYFRMAMNLEPEEAMNMLGAYLGDDGVTLVKDPNEFAEHVRKLGHKLEAVECDGDKVKVQFLARDYSPRVFEGCPDSMTDFGRWLGKIHLVDKKFKTDKLEHLWLRCQGYLQTDWNTPFIGDFCQAVTRLCVGINYQLPFDPFSDLNYARFEADLKSHRDSMSYLAKSAFVHHERMPNENDDRWMTDHIEKNYPDFPLEQAITWARQLEAPPLQMIHGEKKKVTLAKHKEAILNLLQSHPFKIDYEVTPTARKDKDIIIHDHGDVRVIPASEAKKEATLPDKPVVPMHQKLGMQALKVLSQKEDHFKLLPGGSKCMYVIWNFFDRVRKMRRAPKGTRRGILYTGSFGSTQFYASHLLSGLYCPVHFFDTQYAVPENKETVDRLSRYVTVRSCRVRANVMSQSAESFDRVYWLDDLFTQAHAKSRVEYNTLKCAILDKVRPDFAIVKFMTNCTSSIPVGEGVTYYKTSHLAPFENVREIRVVVDGTLPYSFEELDLNKLVVEEVPHWQMALDLQDAGEYLTDNPPRECPKKGRDRSEKEESHGRNKSGKKGTDRNGRKQPPVQKGGGAAPKQ